MARESKKWTWEFEKRHARFLRFFTEGGSGGSFICLARYVWIWVDPEDRLWGTAPRETIYYFLLGQCGKLLTWDIVTSYRPSTAGL